MVRYTAKAVQAAAMFALISGAQTGFAKLSDVHSLINEKSWQLALEQIEKEKSDSLSEEEKRERLYLKGLSYSELRQESKAQECFIDLTKDKIRDQWAGLAFERLQRGMPPNDYYLNTTTSEPLYAIKKADEILTEVKYSDLKGFYNRAIFSNLTQQNYPNEADRDYLLGLFDKATLLNKDDDEALAALLFRKENFYDSQKARKIEERLAGLQSIVKEFPKTKSALQAQEQIAQLYYGTGDYVKTCYEYNVLISNFPNTDEAKNAKELVAQIQAPGVMVQVGSIVLPGEKLTVPVAARNTGKVTVSAIPFDPMQWMSKNTDAPDFELEKIKGKAALTQSVDFETRDDYKPTTKSLELTIAAPGTYVLKAETEGGKASATSLVVVSDMTLLSNTSAGKLEFWAVDSKTGRPKQGADVSVFLRDRPNRGGLLNNLTRKNEVLNARTNNDGFADIEAKNEDGQVFIIAKLANNYAILGSAYLPRIYTHDNYRQQTYIYTDRPVYRPEQDVFWRAILRNRKDGEYSIPKDGTYNVNVYDARNQKVSEQTGLKLSEYGSLEGNVKIPPGAPLGNYRIEVRSSIGDQGYGTQSFSVEEYKKPEFEVAVSAKKDFAKVNDELEAVVDAKYLFGGAVQEGDVSYTVKRRPRFWMMREALHWALDKDYGWFEDANSAGQNRPGRMHNSSGDIVSQGVGKLDADGKFTIKFKAEVPENELKAAERRPDVLDKAGFNFFIWPPRNPNVWDFQVEVTVTDKSRRNIDSSSVIPVGLKALQVEGMTPRRIVLPGDTARAEFKSFNLSKKPVQVKGTVFIEKVVYNPTTEKDDVTTLTNYQLDTGTSGSVITDWKIPADTEGMIRFAFECEDPFGGTVVSYVPFTVASENTKDLFVRYSGVSIIADKTKYEVGDTARVIVLNEFKDAVAWYWVYAESGNLEKRVIALPNRTNFLTIPITDGFAPNCMLNIATVQNKMVYRDNLELVVPPTRKTLIVELLTPKDKLAPGAEESVKIRVKDFEGKPVKGEFSLSVFDNAITYIVPDSRQDIRKAFYAMRRNVSQNVQESIGIDGRYGSVNPPEASQYLSGYLNPAHWGEIKQKSDFQPVYALREMNGGATRLMTKTMSAGDVMGRVAAPPPAAVMAEASMDMPQLAKEEAESEGAVNVRSDFRDSVYWSGNIVTDDNGEADVKIKMPDSLTTWKIVTVGIDKESRVGNQQVNVVTSKDVIARLEVPRFFRERDSMTISGIVHNYSKEDLAVSTNLEAEGVTAEGGNAAPITIKAGGEARVDYKVTVKDAAAGNATLKFTAKSSVASDALARTVPVVPHGIDKFVAWNGTLADETTAGLTRSENGGKVNVERIISIPKERIAETSRLTVNITPSLARVMKDALPYMIEYPYGCVEQTMNRFVPAAAAIGTFRNMGIPVPADVADKIPAVTKEGLQRLADMQNGSGGWGWWYQDKENIYLTAYVMNGLMIARGADISVDDAMFSRGLARLEQLSKQEYEQVSKDKSVDYGYYSRSGLNSLALAQFVLVQNGKSDKDIIELLWQRRDKLGNNATALLARTLWKANRQDDARVVLRNMYNFAVITKENNTARWGLIDRGWYWWDNPVESTAAGLQAFLEISPNDPITDQAVKWLVLNRSGAQWKSTKDTANTVIALGEYMKIRKESSAAANIEVKIGNKVTKKLVIDPKNFWDFDGKIVLEGKDVPDGYLPVIITSDNPSASLYYSVFAEYFTTEENIAAAGNEIFVERKYEKLNREANKNSATDKVAAKDVYTELKPGDVIRSGDEIRVSMKIRSLNDYEYIMIEDAKAAGMEPVDVTSGFRCSGGLCGHMEMRDQKTVFFFSNLPQGEHTLEYNVRAEIPGEFHVMPTLGSAMYFPILRANSAENVIGIQDKE